MSHTNDTNAYILSVVWEYPMFNHIEEVSLKSVNLGRF